MAIDFEEYKDKLEAEKNDKATGKSGKSKTGKTAGKTAASKSTGTKGKKSKTAKLYTADEFYPIGDEMLEAWKKNIDYKKNLYKQMCDEVADLLNESGLHEKFVVDPYFINNYAGLVIEEANGIFLRSSRHVVVCTFSIIEKTGVSVKFDIEKANK